MSNKTFNFIISAKTQGLSNIRKAGAGLKAFNREVKDGIPLLSGLQGEVASMAGAALGLAGILGAGIGLKNLTVDTIAAEKELTNFARTAGLSVGDFQAYAYAVQTVGFEQDKLADISKDVKDKIGDFIETGGGEFADFFENVAVKAGVTAEQLIKLSGPDALIAVKKAMDDANVSAENQVFYLEGIANDASLLIPLLENEGKAWKELAQNARDMGVAISDLDHESLLELNDVLRDFRTNLGVTKREIVLALSPAIKEMAEYLAENNDEIRAYAVAITESVGKTIEWVVNNREAILTVGKLTAGIFLLSKAITTTTALINGARAATLAMTGANVTTWFSTMATGLKGVQIAALGTAAGIGAAAGATLALAGGYAIGRKIDEWQYFSDVVEANKNALAEVPEKFREISEATGVTIRSFDDLNKAQKKGLIEFDDAKGEWVKGAGEMAEAVKKSAEEQEQVSSAKLKEMEKAYKKYADQVKKLQDQIAGRERDLAAELRELSRSGMSELGAWRDRKKEAEEYYKAAEKAAQAGDYKTAVELADKAKEAYADLNTEVKEGEKVQISQATALKSAMTGVEKAGKLAIDILKQQKEAAAEAADGLNAESGFQLADKNLSSMTEKTKEYGNSIDMVRKKWSDAFVDMVSDGERSITEIEKRFRSLERDRHVKVYVEEVVKRATGGLASGSVLAFAGGGSPMYFPRHTSPLITKGSGLRDDVPALLKRREFIQPDTSVNYYGVRFMELIRRRLFPRELAMRFATGGTPAGAVSLGSSSAQSLGHYTLDFNLPGESSPVRVLSDRENLDRLVNYAERRRRLSS